MHPLRRPPQTPHQRRVLRHRVPLQHLVDEAHVHGAHLLDDLLEPLEALRLLRLGGLLALAEDVLGFAVTFAAGLRVGLLVSAAGGVGGEEGRLVTLMVAPSSPGGDVERGRPRRLFGGLSFRAMMMALSSHEMEVMVSM